MSQGFFSFVGRLFNRLVGASQLYLFVRNLDVNDEFHVLLNERRGSHSLSNIPSLEILRVNFSSNSLSPLSVHHLLELMVSKPQPPYT